MFSVVLARRRDPFVVLELLPAIAVLGARARDLDEHDRIRHGVRVLGIALDTPAHDADVRIGLDPRVEDADAQIGGLDPARARAKRRAAPRREITLAAIAACSGGPPAIA
jgi:hypothetical protein